MHFQKAIQESESEWTQHKKLIDTSAKGLRRSIPPHFSYFYVQFGLQQGFAHVIEDHTKFPRFFGQVLIFSLFIILLVFQMKKNQEDCLDLT